MNNTPDWYDKITQWFHKHKLFAIVSILVTAAVAITTLCVNWITLFPRNTKANTIADSAINHVLPADSNTVIPVSKKDAKYRVSSSEIKIIVTGTVRDDSTNETLEGVLVSANNKKANDITDVNGNFSITLTYRKSLEEICLALSFSKPGYRPKHNTETINFKNVSADEFDHPTFVSLQKLN